MYIYIIRHGETDMNVKGVLQGVLDEPLNQAGRDLAAITAQAMGKIHFDECFSSPLVRAKETAEIVLKETGNDIPVQIDERIQEMNFGEAEGNKLKGTGEDARLFMFDSFNFPGFPGGEDFHQLCARTQDFLKELIARDDDKTYLIATHGCALRAMLNFLYEDPSSFWQKNVPYNCCVNIIEVKDGEAKLIAEDKIYYPDDMIVDRYRS